MVLLHYKCRFKYDYIIYFTDWKSICNHIVLHLFICHSSNRRGYAMLHWYMVIIYYILNLGYSVRISSRTSYNIELLHSSANLMLGGLKVHHMLISLGDQHGHASGFKHEMVTTKKCITWLRSLARCTYIFVMVYNICSISIKSVPSLESTWRITEDDAGNWFKRNCVSMRIPGVWTLGSLTRRLL